MKPDTAMGRRREEALRSELDRIAREMSDEDRAALEEKNKALRALSGTGG